MPRVQEVDAQAFAVDALAPLIGAERMARYEATARAAREGWRVARS